MHADGDPLVPFGTRFPLSPSEGRVAPIEQGSTGTGRSRPFGMRYAVRPIVADRHHKRPTNKTRTKQTAITNDGQISGYQTDVEHYVEMDEE